MIYLNGKPVNVTIFPDKTSQVWHLEQDLSKIGFGLSKITWIFESESEIMHLAQLKTLLANHGISASLHMTYLPYGRQDKGISNDSTFAMHTFCNLIEHMGFTTVSCMDPHSEFMSIYFGKYFKAIYPTELVKTVYNLTSSNVLCYPDAGATLKYHSIYENYPNVCGVKERDQATGNITSYKLVGDVYDKKVLIVDDICDGGATFIALTKQLLDNGATEVNMFVTHGVFSKGVKILKRAGIKRVFTAKGEAEEYEQFVFHTELK